LVTVKGSNLFNGLEDTLIHWNSVSIKGFLNGRVRFLKDQPFDAVSAIILIHQGALNRGKTPFWQISGRQWTQISCMHDRFSDKNFEDSGSHRKTEPALS